jgi:hypothetical protein
MLALDSGIPGPTTGSGEGDAAVEAIGANGRSRALNRASMRWARRCFASSATCYRERLCQMQAQGLRTELVRVGIIGAVIEITNLGSQQLREERGYGCTDALKICSVLTE